MMKIPTHRDLWPPPRSARRVLAFVAVSAGLLLAFQVRPREDAGVQPLLTAADERLDGGPAEPYFAESHLAWILEPVRTELESGAFPGASVAVGHGAEERHLFALGRIGWTRNASEVDAETTVYDLASVTKVVATASAVMLLVQDGRITLDTPIGEYIPDFREGAKGDVTFRHLLTHTSGVPRGAILRGENRRQRIARAATFPIYPPAGARVEYSDVGYVLLWEATERATGEPLTQFLERRLYAPLGMSATRFSPGLDCEACAPTGRLRDQSLYRGKPFDPLAQRLDGVSGNAGLFSTAADLARFAAMIANGGELDGIRIFTPETIQTFTGPQPVGGRYRLGWEVLCADEEPQAEGCESPLAIGHTGWTGTSIWIDLDTATWVVLLTNRTYESRAPNNLQAVRREMLARARDREALGLGLAGVGAVATRGAHGAADPTRTGARSPAE